MVDMTRRVPQVPQIGARATFSARHSGSRGTDTSTWRARDPGHSSKHALGVRDVLEHLDRGDEIELTGA